MNSKICQPIIWPIIQEYHMEMKRNWAGGGGVEARPCAPLNSPIHHIFSRIITGSLQRLLVSHEDVVSSFSTYLKITSLHFPHIGIYLSLLWPEQKRSGESFTIWRSTLHSQSTLHTSETSEDLQNNELCPGLRGHDVLTSGWFTTHWVMYCNGPGIEPNANSPRALTRTVHTLKVNPQGHLA